jgi:hypothetical protein
MGLAMLASMLATPSVAVGKGASVLVSSRRVSLLCLFYIARPLQQLRPSHETRRHKSLSGRLHKMTSFSERMNWWCNYWVDDRRAGEAKEDATRRKVGQRTSTRIAAPVSKSQVATYSSVHQRSEDLVSLHPLGLRIQQLVPGGNLHLRTR